VSVTHHTPCFWVFRVSFLFCIFSALFAHIYFTVVSRLSSVRSGRARSTPAKRCVLSSKGGHTAFCVGRESADGLIHSGLGSSDKVLCASGCAWARGSRRGQLIERELGEAADPAVYTLLLLRSPIEGEAEWGVGVTCLSGVRERGNETCRSIPIWESSEGR